MNEIAKLFEEGIKKDISNITGKPIWWFKSNNWKKMHGYPMLSQQKKVKYKIFKKYEVQIFKTFETMFEDYITVVNWKEM